ncbi:MAG: type II 3-dehydroquinate dehydratase [Clostridia bacterium]|nr:type II 3-dehydroquinate dehydratase [Clostridia bacterium]MBR4186780.1 type II 3-dehydroquinate dehydratase [Clostridia bacterium]
MKKKTKKILVLNGPNLNMLGIREPDVYGRRTYRDLVSAIEEHAKERSVFVTVFQSNSEAVLVTKIQRAFGIYDGIVINPAAYTHTSIALLDAVKAVSIPTVEVHLSDVSEREDFRQVSYVRLAAAKTIMGRGFDGYLEAIDYLLDEVFADGGGAK